MDRYNVNQLNSVKGFNVAIMKFEETESLDGTLRKITSDPEGDYLILEQHGDEKIRLDRIEEIYLLLEGYLPVYYCPLDDYDSENSFYPEEYFEAFYDFVGEDLRVLGLFGDAYEIEGVLTDIDPVALTLTIENKIIDLWRINIVLQIDEEGKGTYISPESMGDTFEDPLDNLYSEEDFEMLVGKKIRIKTMVPEIADEVATVAGYTMGEGFGGEDVYHLELEEFPDHLLEPSEIQFIYLIGDDGSETLIEPSGGSLYGQQRLEEDEVLEDDKPDSKYFQEFLLGVSSRLKPVQLGKDLYQLMDLKFNSNEFQKITTAIKEWYEEGTPNGFERQITKDIKVFDSNLLPHWYNQSRAIEEGYQKSPSRNYPVILIQDNRVASKEGLLDNFIYYSLMDIDMLNEDFGLGLNNSSYAIGRMYEMHAASEEDVLDHYKHAIINYKEHLKNYPKHVLALNSIGNNLYILAKYEDALNYLDQALAICPDWAVAIANKVEVLLNLNRFNEASLLIDKGESLEPDNGEWVWCRAKLKDREGDREQARKLGEKAVKMGYLTEEDLLSML